MPVANKAAADQVRATENIALQQQMKSAGANTPVTAGDIQGMAGQVAGQRAAVNQAEQQAGLSKTIDTAQRDFQAQQNTQAQQNIMDDQARAQARIDAEERLAALGSDVKETLLNRELALNENTNQLQFTNERQLADLATKLAADDRALNSRLQEMQQASDTRLAAATYAANQMAEAADFAAKDRRISQDNEMMSMIRERQQQAKEQERKAKKKAAATGKIIAAAKIAAGVGVIAATGGIGASAVGTAAGGGMISGGIGDAAATL